MTRAWLTAFALPMRRPFVTARGTYHTRDGALLRIAHRQLVGCGEASPLPGFSTETLAQAKAELTSLLPALEALQDRVICADPSALEALLVELNAEALSTASSYALEVALCDLSAKAQGISVARWLDADAASSVPVNATITSQAPHDCFTRAMLLREQGFECFKLKVGVGSLEQDLARVRAVREAIGDVCALRLDANGAWSQDQALEAFAALRPFGIDFIEQPVSADHAAQALMTMARLRRDRAILVAADESARTAGDLDRVLVVQAADVIVLKPALIGSLIKTRALIARARGEGLRVIVTTLLDGAVGRAAAAQVAMSCGIDEACGLATGDLFERDLCAAQDRVARGRWWAKDDFGLGVTIDRVKPAPTQLEPKPVKIPNPLTQRAKWTPDQPAIIEGEHTWSWSQLESRARAYAGALLERGITAYDRVALSLPVSFEAAALIHALHGLGAVLVAINERLLDHEQLEHAQRALCALMITDRALEGAPFEVVSVTSLLDGPARGLDGIWRDEIALHEPLALLFTSGTTGTPKMPLLSWRSMVMNVMGSAIQLGHLPSDIWLHAMPLGHVAGLSILWRSVVLGIPARLLPKYSADAVADALISGQCTQVSLVSRMLWQVLESLDGRPVAPGFRLVLLGGGEIPRALLERCRELKLPVAPTFGMSEGASQLLTLPPTTDAVDLGVGWPLIFTQASLGQDDQLHVRGASLFEGYATPQDHHLNLTPPAQWFDTGDFASYLPCGHLKIEARRQDRIVTGGENVSVSEVEDTLLAYPGVREVCVVGLPDEQWGQRIVGVIVCDDTVLWPKLLEHCRQRLVSFKVPRQLVRWAELPRGALDKVSREAVRQKLGQAPTSQT